MSAPPHPVCRESLLSLPMASGPSGRGSSIGRLVVINTLVIMLCIAAGAIFSYSRGQDVNYDQLNYHFYIAHAFLTDRLSQDVAPGQIIHSFFSPVIYLPFYFLVRNFPPQVVGMALGGLHGLNFWLVGIIAWIITSSIPRPARIAIVSAAIAISAASPMALAEIGTSFADILVSLLVLGGLALLMSADLQYGRRASTTICIGLAGALLGAATSLKLTCAVFSVALAFASLAGWKHWQDRLTAVLTTAFGAVIGFVAGGGFWYLLMWRKFQNPVFPYFNALFRSPDYPSAKSFFDPRFVPHNVVDALSYPFLWTRTQQITDELLFRDIRFASFIILGALACARQFAQRTQLVSRAPPITPASRRLISFFVIAFCLWMYIWSIQRYIVVLELLLGPALVALLQWSGIGRIGRGWALAAIGGALAVACAVTVVAPDFGHLRWDHTWYTVDIPPAANAHPVYFLDGEPLSYVAPKLQPGSAVIDVIAWENLASMGDTVFQRRVKALLADPDNDELRAIALGPLSQSFKTTMAQYGLTPERDCATTSGRPAPLTWCHLKRVLSTN